MGCTRKQRLTRRFSQSREPDTVDHKRRLQSFQHSYTGPTVIAMVDGGDAWSAYLRRMTQRPGWSVARLARESGLHRSSIFNWIKHGAQAITIQAVYMIADALGEDRETALRAAGNIPPGRDPEVDLILAANRTDEQKAEMINRLIRRREEEERRRLEDLRFMLGVDEDQAAG